MRKSCQCRCVDNPSSERLLDSRCNALIDPRGGAAPRTCDALFRVTLARPPPVLLDRSHRSIGTRTRLDCTWMLQLGTCMSNEALLSLMTTLASQTSLVLQPSSRAANSASAW